MPELVTREVPDAARAALERAGVAPVLARVFAARGLTGAEELSNDFARLLAPDQLTCCDAAAAALADAIERNERLLIVADYDCDGATACAVGIRALRAFGARVEFLVPNRFEYGYGLTPEIVDLAHQRRPDWLITVDNGIASVAGVERARALGMRVLVTDHHLPGDQLPAAEVIVNPNQPGCGFPSKHLAGVGVMFYVMLALRAELRRRGRLPGNGGPNLAQWLDLVALGTVADVVRLDANNRILVAQGLKRIRAMRTVPGIAALLRVAGRAIERCTTYDLGFVAGPRLNAAGRLQDMSLGIECLVTDDVARAGAIAGQLDQLNRQRREIEATMREQALAAIDLDAAGDGWSVSLFDPAWHQGVIGIVAARLKDRLHRPAFCFARGDGGILKGSGRSIAGLHLRDALDLVDKRAPGLLVAFGGHAAAAGLSLREADLPRFTGMLEDVVRSLLTPADLSRVIETDGSLEGESLDLNLARSMDEGVWGPGFPRPEFIDRFDVTAQKVVGQAHSKLELRGTGGRVAAIRFNSVDPLPPRIEAVYRIDMNSWQGLQSVQLTIEHWRAAGGASADWN
ncbi:MAG: single-stranded-DNA-specific exonuclease RecJ [Pseudomonadota bacterium]